MTPATPVPDVLVVGGGVAGLAAGHALAGAGLRVRLCEAASRLGGRASSSQDAVTGDMLDIGPHVLATDYRHFRALIDKAGAGTEVLWQRQPLIHLLDRGRVLPMKASGWTPPLQALPNLPRVVRRMGWAAVLSNLRLGWRVLRGPLTALRSLDAIDAGTWLAREGVHPRFVDWFWRSATMAVLNVPLEDCSAFALARVFRLMASRSGYAFGFPRVALQSLYAPGCEAAIVDAGGEVRLGTPATACIMEGGRVVGVRLADGQEARARAVVLAIPPRELAALAPAGWAEAARAAAGLRPCRYISTYLWFDRRLTQERFWARVWSPEDLNMDFYDLSNIRPGGAAAPSLIAANAIHAGDGPWRLDDDEIVRRTRAELAEFAPQAAVAQLRHAAVHRIEMAIPCPVPGSEALRMPQATPFEGLWLAGDWTDTGLPCSMESAARSGALAAEQVGAALGRTIRVVQPVPPPQGLAGWLSAA